MYHILAGVKLPDTRQCDRVVFLTSTFPGGNSCRDLPVDALDRGAGFPQEQWEFPQELEPKSGYSPG